MGTYLPQEILSYILRFLGVSDRKAASRVCRGWYRASLDSALLSDVVYVFHSWSTFDTALPMLQSRFGVNVVIEGIDNSLAIRSSLTSLPPDSFAGIRSLSLAGCDLTEGIFTLILARCIDLELLDISRCNALFMTGQLLSKSSDIELLKQSLAHVSDLNLRSIRYLSDCALNRLLTVCPNIRRLNLSGNQIVFHTDIYFGIGKLADRSANSAVVTFSNIMSSLESKASQLLTLDFSRTSINDDAVSNLVKLPGLQLRELSLAHCQELTDVGIVAISKAQPSLRFLDISDCLAIRDSSLEAICAGLSELRILNVGKCRQLTDMSACKLRSLSLLQQLDFNACYTMTPRGLGLGLCSTTTPLNHLTSLTLSCCSSVHDAFVIEMTACLTNLSSLDLSSCGVGNAGLHAISARLTRLRHLRLAWCQDITDDGLLGLRESDSHVHDDDDVGLCKCTRRTQSLHIFNPPRPSAKVPAAAPRAPPTLDAASIRPITNLRRLVTLDLTSCHRITDTSVANVMSFLELQCLNLSLCLELSDNSLTAIAVGLPSLEELHLAQCTRVTDFGIMQISERLHRLTFLNVSSCDQLTNRSLESLFLNSKGLHQLDVSLCSGITAAAVEMLENGLGHLVSVHKRHIGIKA